MRFLEPNICVACKDRNGQVMASGIASVFKQHELSFLYPKILLMVGRN